MRTRMLQKVVIVAAAALLSACSVRAQAPSEVRVTGAEIQAWFDADQMAVAGVGMASGCHWITKGPMDARSQTLYCPNSQPLTVTGEARVEGDLFCPKFTYPNGNKYEGCQEIHKVGDNKYEMRANGRLLNVFYRLVR